MIYLKKAMKSITGVVASLILASAAVPVTTASATTYDNCDVDRNGYVETADLVLLNKYLSGQFSVSNYNQLDVNKSLTVDAADEECLTARLTGSIYQACYYSRAYELDASDATNPNIQFPTISGFVSDGCASSTAPCSYIEYLYETGETNTYTLTPTVTTLNTGVNSRKIIDNNDSRYRAYGSENTGIVNLGEVGATGFIVGDHLIATAAHCVYDNYNKLWEELEIFMYNENGVLNGIELTPIEAHIPTRHITNSDARYDYALITVKEDLSDSKYNCTFFSLANSYNLTASDYASIPIYLTGCPATKPNTTWGTNEFLYSEQGNVISNVNTFKLKHDIDSSQGQSGSPIYTIIHNINDDSYIYSAIAIHSGGDIAEGYNTASLVTKYHLQFYYNNAEINYN